MRTEVVFNSGKGKALQTADGAVTVYELKYGRWTKRFHTYSPPNKRMRPAELRIYGEEVLNELIPMLEKEAVEE